MSADVQSLDAQVRHITKAVCSKVSSGTVREAKTNHAASHGAGRAGVGDVFIVTQLDRLARTTRTPSTLSPIARRLPLRDHAWAADGDGAGRSGGLRGQLIRARTGGGRARAVSRGVKMGWKPKLTPNQIKMRCARWYRGACATSREAMMSSWDHLQTRHLRSSFGDVIQRTWLVASTGQLIRDWLASWPGRGQPPSGGDGHHPCRPIRGAGAIIPVQYR